MLELLKEVWILLVLFIILIAIMIIFHIPFNPYAFIGGGVVGVIISIWSE